MYFASALLIQTGIFAAQLPNLLMGSSVVTGSSYLGTTISGSSSQARDTSSILEAFEKSDSLYAKVNFLVNGLVARRNALLETDVQTDGYSSFAFLGDLDTDNQRCNDLQFFEADALEPFSRQQCVPSIISKRGSFFHLDDWIEWNIFLEYIYKNKSEFCDLDPEISLLYSLLEKLAEDGYLSDRSIMVKRILVPVRDPETQVSQILPEHLLFIETVLLQVMAFIKGSPEIPAYGELAEVGVSASEIIPLRHSPESLSSSAMKICEGFAEDSADGAECLVQMAILKMYGADQAVTDILNMLGTEGNTFDKLTQIADMHSAVADKYSVVRGAIKEGLNNFVQKIDSYAFQVSSEAWMLAFSLYVMESNLE